MAQAQLAKIFNEETEVTSTTSEMDDYSLMSMDPYLDWLDLRTDENPLNDDVIIDGSPSSSVSSSPTSSPMMASEDGIYPEWYEDTERERNVCLRYLKGVIEKKNDKIRTKIEKYQERVDSLIEEYQRNLQELRDLDEI